MNKQAGEDMLYEQNIKEEAIILSDKIGTKKAASQLGIPYNTLTGWRRRKNTSSRAYVENVRNQAPDDSKDRDASELENSRFTAKTETLSKTLKDLGVETRSKYITRESILTAILTGDREKQRQIERIESLYHHFQNAVRYQQHRQAVYILITMIQIGKKMVPATEQLRQAAKKGRM